MDTKIELDNTKIFIRPLEYYIILILLISCIIFQKYLVLTKFIFTYVDSDQAIMWHAAKAYYNGIFHEPRFYGQNYNSMLEAFLAAPLISINVPIIYAVSITTSILATFPYFIISILCHIKKLKHGALLALLVPLSLPFEYDIISGLPRGFITGIFIASFSSISLFYPNKKTIQFFTFLFAIIGFSLNPNSLLLSIPILFFVFLENIENISFYLISIIASTIGVSIHFFVNSFYSNHPNYNSRIAPNFNWGFNYFRDGISNADELLNTLTPILRNSGWINFIIPIVLMIWFYNKKEKGLLFSSSIYLAILVASFSLEKVYDGTTSVFFSKSRMFLAVPVVMTLFIAKVKIENKFLFLVILTFVSISYVQKISTMNSVIERCISPGRNHIISVDNIQNIKNECYKINSIVKKHNVSLIIIYDHGYYDFIEYGCDCNVENFPETIRPEYERRTWRLIEESENIHSNIIIIDEHEKLLEKIKQKGIPILNYDGYYVITKNKMKSLKLITNLGIPIRKFN